MPRPIINPDWHRPAKCTCSVWTAKQIWSFGGRAKIIRSPHYRWLFRVLWSPDGQIWYGYIPLTPVPRGSPWYQVLWHSLWFEGYVRQEKTKSLNKSGHLALNTKGN